MRPDSLPAGLSTPAQGSGLGRTRGENRPLTDWVFESLGTRWVVSTPEPLDDATRAAVTAELDRIDRFWSRFRDDSVVAEMATRPGRYRLHDGDEALIAWYRRLHGMTDGALTPFVGDTLADAGYDASYSLRPRADIRAVPVWDEVLGPVDGEGILDVRVPTTIDVGAAGKGFAVDRVAAIIADVTGDYIVDGGGDMVISRPHPVRIALEHPLDAGRAIGVVELASGSICASASNRRAWADWHHIVDPRSSSPAREVLASWAVIVADDASGSGMIADGLATALFFVPGGRLHAQMAADLGDRFGFVTVRRNGVVEHHMPGDRSGPQRGPGLELFL